MSEVIRVLAARTPDRDRLLALLSDNGHDARPVDDIEIDVYCAPGGGVCGPAVFANAEDAVMDIGDAFVPVKHDGVIYVRPPVG